MTVPAAPLPRVRVLMATFNGGRFIADQLATILHQQAVEVSVCVRDDGSSDDTIALVDAEARRDARVKRLVKQDKPTGSAARNFLRLLESIELSDVDYVAFSDQDDLWLGHKLRRGVDLLTATGAAGYSSDLMAFDDAGVRASWRLDKHGRQRRWDYLFQGASAGCTYILTRAVVERIRPWLRTLQFPDGHGISHDWLIYAYVRSQELGWVCDSAAPILYRQHGGNVYGSRRGLTDIAARIKLLRSGWYRSHIRWLADQLNLSAEGHTIRRRLDRMALRDRLWLIANARHFRRRPREILLLCVALAAGLV